MSDPVSISDSVRTGRLSQEALLVAMADLVISVDDVLRLEPTIRNRLRQLSGDPVTAIGAAATPPDGVACKKNGRKLDATVEVAIRPGRSAAETAEEIQRQVRALIVASGWEPGSVMVSVLALERP